MIPPSKHINDPDSESGLSRLNPPKIPKLITSIDGDEGYHGGIGDDALKDDLRVTVDPWLNMDLDDKCLLFWKDEGAAIKTELIDTPEKIDQKIYFDIPEKQILGGSAFPVFFRVIRASNNHSDSDKLNVLVKRTLPGGVLVKPEPLGHPGLRYTLIPDVKDGVDREMVRNGIAMRIEPYLNITVFDRIVARWGSEEQMTHYPVTLEQIKDPTNHPIIITFDEALIKRAGDGIHDVTYQVIDRCNNRPHEHAPWAVVTKVEVDLKRNPLPPPTVTGEEDGVLDTAFVTTIKVVASGIGLNTGDSVWVEWNGRVERKTTAQSYSGSGTLVFDIPLSWAHESTESSVIINYKVKRDVRELTSDPKSLAIKTTIDLKLPKVLEAYGANGDRLKMADIYTARHVTIQIPQYVGMAIGQTIRARWANARHIYDSPITTVEKVGPMDFEVPRLEVVDAIGSTVPVSCTVRTFPNGPLHRSDPLPLAVDAQTFALRFPRITSDKTEVTIRYPGMATGYHARVRFAGVVTRKTAWQDLSTDTAVFSIPASWIEENKGKTVLINYSVNRPGIDEQSQFSQVLRESL
ncbi:hypothetical protein [Pseudomonas sp.]|jgi:hypothetical protein|uniref:hypothetical protein n=1 Tax=Pseudomonas sp. TaxID=306 RepID=UPI0032657EDF